MWNDSGLPERTDTVLMTHRSDYVEEFSGGTRQAEALKVALDIRKFEIEMYWKRAAYFWTILALAFAGYFALKPDLLREKFTVACLGLVFAVAWYCVNRGSSAWQRNWERQVDLLEDEIIGPLYKSVVDKRTYSFWKLSEPYGFSPSRINTLLSLFACAVWLTLAINTAAAAATTELESASTVYLIAITSLAASAVLALFLRGATIATDETIEVDIHRRRYK